MIKEDEIECVMYPNGEISWNYYLYDSRNGIMRAMTLNHKTAVIEIKQQLFTQKSHQMRGENLVITYKK